MCLFIRNLKLFLKALPIVIINRSKVLIQALLLFSVFFYNFEPTTDGKIGEMLDIRNKPLAKVLTSLPLRYMQP